MNPEKVRNRLFEHLDKVLAISDEKFSFNKKRDEQRLKWGRLLVNAIGTYGKLLESHELEQLAKDVELIKEKLGMETN